MKTIKKIALSAWLLGMASVVLAQPQQQRLINVNIAPRHSDWVYKPGETVKFDVSVTKNDVLVPDV